MASHLCDHASTSFLSFRFIFFYSLCSVIRFLSFAPEEKCSCSNDDGKDSKILSLLLSFSASVEHLGLFGWMGRGDAVGLPSTCRHREHNPIAVFSEQSQQRTIVIIVIIIIASDRSGHDCDTDARELLSIRAIDGSEAVFWLCSLGAAGGGAAGIHHAVGAGRHRRYICICRRDRSLCRDGRHPLVARHNDLDERSAGGVFVSGWWGRRERFRRGGSFGEGRPIRQRRRRPEPRPAIRHGGGATGIEETQDDRSENARLMKLDETPCNPRWIYSSSRPGTVVVARLFIARQSSFKNASSWSGKHIIAPIQQKVRKANLFGSDVDDSSRLN